MKLFLSIVFILSSITIYSQELLKEVSKTFDNGQPMYIDYVEMENLKKVKTEMFNEDGKLIFSIQFNPETGLPDGKFYDLINKGFFKNGVLTCYKCMLVDSNSPSVFTYNYNRQNTKITKGDIINGRFVGQIKYSAFSEGTYNKVDWNSTKRYVAAGAGIGFRDVKTYRTGVFKKYEMGATTYNSNGQIEGNYTRGRIYYSVKNGLIKSYVKKDKSGLVVDSLSNNNELWKINYKWRKNDGYIVFDNPNNIGSIIIPNFRDKKVIEDWERNPRNDGEKLGPTDINAVIIIGGNSIVEYDKGDLNIYQRNIEINSGGKPSILDSNGIYSINRDYQGSLYESLYFDMEGDLGRYFKINDFNQYSPDKRIDSSREYNLFTLVYNFLINNSNNIFEKEFVFYPYSESGQTLSYFLTLMGGDDTSPFKKYLKINFEPTKDIDGWGGRNSKKIWPLYEWRWKNDNYGNDVKEYFLTAYDFFSKVITMPDYLKAISESFSSESTEMQELIVWNYKTKKYDLVDFENLISIALEKLEKEAAEQAAAEQAAAAAAAAAEKIKKEKLEAMAYLGKQIAIKDLEELRESYFDLTGKVAPVFDAEKIDQINGAIVTMKEILYFAEKEIAELDRLTLKSTSDKEQNKEKYSRALAKLVKKYKIPYGIYKIEDFIYDKDKPTETLFYKYFYDNMENLENFSKSLSGTAWEIKHTDMDNLSTIMGPK
tara:strand:+ start:444 stop:2579 length:2136 start_codon:yes stop_codon:yes gene_type:complete